MKHKKYEGVFKYRYYSEQLGPLEEKCPAEFDWQIADLINLFIEEDFYDSGENGIQFY